MRPASAPVGCAARGRGGDRRRQRGVLVRRRVGPRHRVGRRAVGERSDRPVRLTGQRSSGRVAPGRRIAGRRRAGRGPLYSPSRTVVLPGESVRDAAAGAESGHPQRRRAIGGSLRRCRAVRLCAAWSGREHVLAIEADRVSGLDLEENARAFADRVRVRRTTVEEFFRGATGLQESTLIVDPPRTGMSRTAMHGILASRAARIVYVSCDVATLARDARRLLDNGYEIRQIEAFDLFPNTAHVEDWWCSTARCRSADLSAVARRAKVDAIAVLLGDRSATAGRPSRRRGTARRTRRCARSSPGATGRPGRSATPAARPLR